MINLKDVVEAAEKQLDLQTEVEKLEASLKDKKEKLRIQSQELVPSMMMELGLEKLILNGGYEISIKDEMYVKMPEDMYNAFSWLRTHDLDSIIKTQVSVEFGKGEDDQAQAVVDMLAEQGIPARAKSTVHPQTLKAILREQMSRGVGIQLDDFGATVVKTTVIRSPK